MAVAFGGQWPTVATLAVCVMLGMTAIGWNGVQLAEVARNAPSGQEGAITGASGFITFGGVLIGPPAFALVSALTGGYRVGFAIFGTVSIAAGLLLLVRHRKGVFTLWLATEVRPARFTRQVPPQLQFPP